MSCPSFWSFEKNKANKNQSPIAGAKAPTMGDFLCGQDARKKEELFRTLLSGYMVFP
jgi:hypothetical protein